MEHGRHVRTALDSMEGGVLRWDGATGRASSTPDPDAVRQLFETIGVLYGSAAMADTTVRLLSNRPFSLEGPAMGQLTGFLDDVKRALINPGRGREMLAAIARYEAVYDPRGADRDREPG